jgi:predicted transcriptional regulator
MKNTDPPHQNKFKKLSPELTHFIESMGRYFESYGIPRIGGRILGLLLVAHEPLSAEDIASILKVSRGSISTNFRLLLTSALAEKVTFPGDRTTYFAFPATAWEKAMAVEIEGIAVLEKLAQQGLTALPSGDPARNRLARTIEWTGLIHDIYQEALTKWRAIGSAQ